MSTKKKLKIKGLILDMDGVLWRDDEPIGDLPGIFEIMNNLGVKFILASNNSTKSPIQYLEKLSKFGVYLDKSQVLGSSQLAASYLKKHHPYGGKVYVIGESGLLSLVRHAGFDISTAEAAAVIVGMDRDFSYEKLVTANHLIRNGAEYIGTNSDLTFPTPQGLAPGAGSILAAISAATGREPRILGKPNSAIFEEAIARMNTTIAETLVVGDRLETDILGGQKMGCLTALVLSGVTQLHQVKEWSQTPDIIVPDLSQLLKLIN